MGDTSHWLGYLHLWLIAATSHWNWLEFNSLHWLTRVSRLFKQRTPWPEQEWRHIIYQKALNNGLYGVAFKLCGASLSSLLLIRIQIKRLVPPSQISMYFLKRWLFYGTVSNILLRGKKQNRILSCHFMSRRVMPPNVAGALPCKIGHHWSDM